MSNKVQVEIVNRLSKDNNAYIALGMNGGYAVKNFLFDDSVHFIGSYAFFIVLQNYLKTLPAMDGVHFNVMRGCTLISCGAKDKECVSALEKITDVLFKGEYDEAGFEAAKEKTKELFARKYKNGTFRARLKAMEVSELNKAFSLKRLIKDIENIDYESFIKCCKALLVPGNMVIYIVGDYEKIHVNEFERLFESNGDPDYSVRIAGPGYNPYFRSDSHVANIAREDVNINVEAFDFLNRDATNFTKQIVLEVLSGIVPCSDVEISVDSLDASIICSSEALCSYKPAFYKLDESKYEAARKSVLAKYYSLMMNEPELFALTGAQLMLNGVYADQLIAFTGSMDYEMFCEICRKADYKITEAQVVLRKEQK